MQNPLATVIGRVAADGQSLKLKVADESIPWITRV
jgi:hypothetical protein